MKKHAGFNLVELLVAMAIIAIIAGVGWPLFVQQGQTNNRTEAIIATNAVALALTQFESDTGSFTWTTPPGAAADPNAHNRYMPLVAVGAASGTIADNICMQDRGFRWVAVNGRYESCRGNYFITVDIGAPGAGDGTGTSFIVTTTPIPGTPQAIDPGDPTNLDVGDHECQQFILDNNATKDYNPSAYLLGKEAKGVEILHSAKRCWGAD